MKPKIVFVPQNVQIEIHCLEINYSTLSCSIT